MHTLFTQIALSDNDDLSKTEVITNIADGIEGSTAFGYSNEYENLSILDMQRVPYKVNHTIEVMGLPTSSVNVSNLESFADPDTDTLVSLIGVDGALISQYPIKAEWVEKPQEGRIWKIRLTLTTVPYRNPNTGERGGGLFVGENLLQLYSFEDANSDGLANGFSQTEFDSTSFSNGEQSLTHNADGNNAEWVFESIFFPFEGENLIFALDIDSRTSGGHSDEVFIRYLDSAGSTISEDTTTFSSTGRKQTSGNIPNGTVKVEVGFKSNDNGAASQSDYTVSNPSLRVDGKDGFTAY